MPGIGSFFFFGTWMDATNLYNAFKKTQDRDSLTKSLF